MKKRQVIDLYRFQLVPISREAQLPLFGDRSPKSPEEAKARKNEYLVACLRELGPLTHRRRDLARRTEVLTDNFVVIRLGIRKEVDLVTKELEAEKIESYPNVLIGINNDPSVQLIGITRNYQAFSSTAVPLGILQKKLNEALREFSLSIHIEALFESSEFWLIASKYKHLIQSVKFELITPNMANISGALELDLTALNKASNSQKTNLELNSSNEGALELDPDNSTINSLVNYASEGGGDISIKIRGIKRRVRTSRSNRTVEIDEFEAEGSSEQIAAMLKEALKGS